MRVPGVKKDQPLRKHNQLCNQPVTKSPVGPSILQKKMHFVRFWHKKRQWCEVLTTTTASPCTQIPSHIRLDVLSHLRVYTLAQISCPPLPPHLYENFISHHLWANKPKRFSSFHCICAITSRPLETKITKLLSDFRHIPTTATRIRIVQ